MAVADWPEGLPFTPLKQGFEATDQDNLARFDPDVGEPMVRAMSTAASREYTVVFPFTAMQRDSFMAFWRETLGRGAVPFVAPHDPETGEEDVIMLFTSPPKRSAVAGGRWRVAIAMMRLP
jgi:hypothetical protein